MTFIKTLKNSKSTGPNSIPTKIFKIIKKLISIPLSTVINKSYANETFPNTCKLAKVVLIFKIIRGYFAIITDQFYWYPTLGKLLKNWMHQRLNQFLEENECFYPHQFGFRLNLSTNNPLCPSLKTFKPGWVIMNLLPEYL